MVRGLIFMLKKIPIKGRMPVEKFQPAFIMKKFMYIALIN